MQPGAVPASGRDRRLTVARRRRRRGLPRCIRCSLLKLPEETFYGGLCPTCHAAIAAKRRAKAGAKLMKRATETRVEERDGQEFLVVVLPEKRRRSRR